MSKSVKYTFTILVFIFPFLIGTASDIESQSPATRLEEPIGDNSDIMKTIITLTVGGKNLQQLFWIIKVPMVLNPCCH